jgi:hypothetical protein
MRICVCEYAIRHHCVAPRFAANPEGIAKIAQTPLPYQKEKIILRTIFQLASQMITHSQALLFWKGLIEAVYLGNDYRDRFIVHPTRLLDTARKEQTLQELVKFAENIRVHFKAFVDDNGLTPWVSGCASVEHVRETDPAYKEGAT